MYSVRYLARYGAPVFQEWDFGFRFHTFEAAHGTVLTLRSLGYAAWSVAC